MSVDFVPKADEKPIESTTAAPLPITQEQKKISEVVNKILHASQAPSPLPLDVHSINTGKQ